jgi:hypothetical protein
VLTSTTPTTSPVVLTSEGSATVGYRVTNVTAHPVTVAWQAASSGDVTISPAAGTVRVPAGGSATASVTVTGGSSDAQTSVTFTGTRVDGTVPSTTIGVDVAAPNELWPYYTNAGIGSDGAATANFDGSGYSYSEQALTAADAGTGATVTVGPLSYTMPTAAPDAPENVEAAGQRIAVKLPAGGDTLGLLAASSHGAAGATGTLTIAYADGTTQQAMINVSDWTLDAGSYQPAPDETIAVTTPYRDHATTTQSVDTYLFSIAVPLATGESSADVTSVTLPSSATADIHVFAIG